MIGRTPTLPSFLTWLDQAAARQPDLARLRQVFQRQTPTWGQNAFEMALWEENEGAAIRAKAAYPWMLPVLAKAEVALGVRLLRPALGRGANGQVFAVDGEPSRVVKVTAEINEVRGLLRFQEHAADGAVTVHAVVSLGLVDRKPDFPQDPREGWAILRDAVTPLSEDEARRLKTTWTGRPVDRATVAPYLPAFSLQPLLDYDQERNLRMWMPRDEDELRPPWQWANDAGFAVNHFLHQGDTDRAQRAWAEYWAWVSWIWALGKETLRPRLFSYLEDASGDDGVFFDFGPHNLGRRPDGQLVWYDLHYTTLSEPVPRVDAVKRALAMSPYAPARPAHRSVSGRDVEAPPARPGPMVIDVTQGAFLPGLLGEAAIYAAATAFAAQGPPDRWSSMLVHTEEGDLGPFRVYPDTTYPKKGTLSALIVRRLGDTENYRWSAKRAGFVGGQEVGEIRRAPFKGSPLDTEAEERQLRRLQRRTGTAKTPANEALNASRVVILRLGLGRDSFTMLALLQEHKLLVQGKEIGPEEIDGVVFTDPGWEWAHSYEAIDDARRICSEMGVPLYVQEKPPAEGPKGWIQWSKDWRAVHDAGEKMGRVRPWQADAAPLPLRSVRNTRPLTPTEQGAIQARCVSGYYHDRPPIMEDYQLRERIIQKKDASCTTNHKVVPSRALIADIAWIRFGVKDNVNWSAQVRKGIRPPHLVLIGIAADEIDRAEKLIDPAFMVYYEDVAFPLIEMGIQREGETPILERHGLGHIRKSGCRMCKFQGPDWFWALSVVDPPAFEAVVVWEKTSLAAAARDGRPLSDARHFRGHVDLEDIVTAWRNTHPDATPDQVFRNEYRACQSRYSEGQRAGEQEEEQPAVEAMRVPTPTVHELAQADLRIIGIVAKRHREGRISTEMARPYVASYLEPFRRRTPEEIHEAAVSYLDDIKLGIGAPGPPPRADVARFREGYLAWRRGRSYPSDPIARAGWWSAGAREDPAVHKLVRQAAEQALG